MRAHLTVRFAAVVFLLTLGSSPGGCPAAAAEPAFPPEQVAFFEKEVWPLLQQHCLKCHGAEDKVRGGLNLTTRAGILEGGDSGPAVDLKNPDSSLLLKAVRYQDEAYQMPPKGRLPDAEIAKLEKWVRAGLPVPAERLKPAPAPARPAPRGGVVTEEAKRYWAFQPVRRPPVPEVRDRSQVRTPIDAFIQARLEAQGLKPVGPADRTVLVRRAYYDLLGLPPTPEEVDAFVRDPDPAAWEKLIDRLLASPHYGEKWGRHWLDVVRYAETNGYERDGPKPFAWRYRDYVIRSFNADKPYTEFVREQLAGDELPGYNPDAVIATGYYRLGTWDDEPADPEQALYDGYDDIVATTSQAFLGLTLNCCRCHEHKADPFPQADYYRLLAFFRDIRPFSLTRDVRSPFNLTDITPPEQKARYEAELKKRQARLAEVRAALEAIENEVIRTLPAEDQRAAEGPERARVIAEKVVPRLTGPTRETYTRLAAEQKELSRQTAPPGQVLALSVNNCDVRPPAVHILIRGSPHAKGKEVRPGFPEIFGRPDPVIPEPKPGARSSGRRSILAEWIASPDNPLTARVFVNRVWQYHFGRGLVPTANDFGQLGEPPSHPELLDWLAAEFMHPSTPPAGPAWTLKRLHKLIMTSAVYQRASTADPDNLRADPANVWLWRFNMRRLSAEEVRDAILAVSGRLNRKLYGPSVYPPLSREVLAGQSMPGDGWPTSPPDEADRRSVYVHVKRSLRVPILVGFDQPDPDTSCPVRYVTTVPTQALGLLNGTFANEQARAFAERLRREVPDDLTGQVTRAIRLTTGRTPPADEVARDVAFVRDLRTKFGLDELTALSRYCLLCLNANEFVYLD